MSIHNWNWATDSSFGDAWTLALTWRSCQLISLQYLMIPDIFRSSMSHLPPYERCFITLILFEFQRKWMSPLKHFIPLLSGVLSKVNRVIPFRLSDLMYLNSVDGYLEFHVRESRTPIRFTPQGKSSYSETGLALYSIMIWRHLSVCHCPAKSGLTPFCSPYILCHTYVVV